jgi:hypothetical protein
LPPASSAIADAMSLRPPSRRSASLLASAWGSAATSTVRTSPADGRKASGMAEPER